MRRSSALALKRRLLEDGSTRRFRVEGELPRSARVRPSALPSARPSPLAVGIAGKGDDFRIAVRVQELHPGLNAVLDDLRRRSRGEMDVEFVGPVVIHRPWHRSRQRPMLIGGSIAHRAVTAGTLGCFVRLTGSSKEVMVLSNNHVLADEDKGALDDEVFQPSTEDEGGSAADTVARLAKKVRLKKSGNLVDAALAELDGVDYFPDHLQGVGRIEGVRTGPLSKDEPVFKLGRTTGKTEGKITATDLDNLEVKGYDVGSRFFDNQVEVQPTSGGSFSHAGDSGAVVLDRRNRIVGLLFAGNDADKSYFNPIGEVMSQLGVTVVL